MDNYQISVFCFLIVGTILTIIAHFFHVVGGGDIGFGCNPPTIRILAHTAGIDLSNPFKCIDMLFPGTTDRLRPDVCLLTRQNYLLPLIVECDGHRHDLNFV